MIDEIKIKEVQGAILGKVIQQCKNGDQSKTLPDGILACGQFLSLHYRDQRGLHGTSAALRVLADPISTDNNELIAGLLKYLINRDEVEKSYSKEQLYRDSINVIKIGEILYSLSFIADNLDGKATYQSQLVNQLKESVIKESGWDYFIGQVNPEIHIIPTAYAIMGLSKVKEYEIIKGPVNFLKEELKKSVKGKSDDIKEFYIQILCLYVLIYYQEDISEDRREYQRFLSYVWKKVNTFLKEDLEQSLEYWYNGEHFYIRIPWQLYLIAIVAKLDSMKLSSVIIQKKLDEIFEEVTTDGFKYPHSGPFLSARTNSILFDTFTKVKPTLHTNILYKILYWIRVKIYHLKMFIRHPVTGYFITTFVICFMLWTFIEAFFIFNKGEANFLQSFWENLTSEFVAVILIFVLSLKKSG